MQLQMTSRRLLFNILLEQHPFQSLVAAPTQQTTHESGPFNRSLLHNRGHTLIITDVVLSLVLHTNLLHALPSGVHKVLANSGHPPPSVAYSLATVWNGHRMHHCTFMVLHSFAKSVKLCVQNHQTASITELVVVQQKLCNQSKGPSSPTLDSA
jgi:hypothetical protein